MSAGNPAPSLDVTLAQVAALRGEPSIVSAVGITRRDTRIASIENRGAFDASPKHRLVLIGGLDGDQASAEAVVAAVRWMKTSAPSAVRQRWIVSAVPLANPDAQPAPFAFPAEKGFYDDAQLPETRYLWRWIVYQAPDAVVVVSKDQSLTADTLVAALRLGHWSGLGAVPASGAAITGLTATLATLLSAPSKTSPLHKAMLDRVARDPLVIARTLARKYPQQATASYIPSVAWTNMLRLSDATGEPEWRAKVHEQTGEWISGAKKMVGDRPLLTSIAGYMIFPELARADRDPALGRLTAEGADLAAEAKDDGIYAHGQGWTDDMFMASSILARAGRLDLVSKQLIAYAGRLQRSDGIFVHATDGPHAWGRGNGFAALGLMEALTAMKADDPGRAPLAEIVKRHASALAEQQAPDGMFRQVIDEPGSYREETATAMLLSAMARGIRLGWLDRSNAPVVTRAWHALAAHIGDDGALVDVCSGTGAGPTKRYYLDRPAINGFDDRGGAMALLAAMEVYELNKLSPAHSTTHRKRPAP